MSSTRSWKIQWWHYLLFFMTLAAASRFLTFKQGPALLEVIFKFFGNLFKGTING